MSPTGSLEITIIIVAHGRPEVLRKTLADLARCDQPDWFRGTIVVENGPPCDMAAVISEFQDRLRIQHETIASPKKTVALNHALRRLGRGWALFIDDDVRVNPNWITVYTTAIAAEPERYYFGGPTSVDYEQRPPEWLIPYLPASARGLEFPDSVTAIRYPECFLGFNWAARVDDLLLAGGFSEDFGPGTLSGGGDESFMQLQLCQRGLQGRVLSSALVWHQIPTNRCSPAWSLKRSYCGGLTAGIEAAWHEQKNKRWCAAIRCHIRHLRNRLASVPVREVVQLSASGRFWMQRTIQWMLGFHEGYRLQGTTHVFPSTNPSATHLTASRSIPSNACSTPERSSGSPL